MTRLAKRLVTNTILFSTVVFVPLPFFSGGCDEFLLGTADFFDDVSDELEDIADDHDHHHHNDFGDFLDDLGDEIEDWFD